MGWHTPEELRLDEAKRAQSKLSDEKRLHRFDLAREQRRAKRRLHSHPLSPVLTHSILTRSHSFRPVLSRSINRTKTKTRIYVLLSMQVIQHKLTCKDNKHVWLSVDRPVIQTSSIQIELSRLAIN